MMISSSKAKQETHKTKIGGMALFEGVMMLSLTQKAMAVRKKDGGIHVETVARPPTKWYEKALFVRGVSKLVKQIKDGYSYMMKSMDISGLLDEDEDEVTDKSADAVADAVEVTPTDAPAIAAAPAPEKESKVQETLIGIVLTVGGIALGVGLFMFVPTYSVTGLNSLFDTDLEPYRSLLEGAIRIVLIVGYMWAISLMKEIRTTYRYHGAEHKTLAAFEAGETLDPGNVENIKKYTRFHPRCGTSFLFLVLTISILIYSGLSIPGMPMNVATIHGFLGEPAEFAGVEQFWATAVRIAMSILSTPFVVGITYELTSLAGRYDRNPFMRFFSAPGLALQRLTVFEPTTAQIEVAVSAMIPVIPKNAKEKEQDKW